VISILNSRERERPNVVRGNGKGEKNAKKPLTGGKTLAGTFGAESGEEKGRRGRPICPAINRFLTISKKRKGVGWEGRATEEGETEGSRKKECNLRPC